MVTDPTHTSLTRHLRPETWAKGRKRDRCDISGGRRTPAISLGSLGARCNGVGEVLTHSQGLFTQANPLVPNSTLIKTHLQIDLTRTTRTQRINKKNSLDQSDAISKLRTSLALQSNNHKQHQSPFLSSNLTAYAIPSSPNTLAARPQKANPSRPTQANPNTQANHHPSADLTANKPT